MFAANNQHNDLVRRKYLKLVADLVDQQLLKIISFPEIVESYGKKFEPAITQHTVYVHESNITLKYSLSKLIRSIGN